MIRRRDTYSERDLLLSSLPIVVPSKTTQSIACFFRPLHFFGSLYPPLVALASSTEKQSTGLFSCQRQARSLCSLAPNSSPAFYSSYKNSVTQKDNGVFAGAGKGT